MSYLTEQLDRITEGDNKRATVTAKRILGILNGTNGPARPKRMLKLAKRFDDSSDGTNLTGIMMNFNTSVNVLIDALASLKTVAEKGIGLSDKDDYDYDDDREIMDDIFNIVSDSVDMVRGRKSFKKSIKKALSDVVVKLKSKVSVSKNAKSTYSRVVKSVSALGDQIDKIIDVLDDVI